MRIVLMLFVVLAGCNNIQSSKDASSNSDSTVRGSIKTETIKTDFTNDSVFTVQFPTDSSQVTVTGKLSGISHPVTAIIPVKQGNQLVATLSTKDSTANIRINQVFTPAGKADGPFGKSVKRSINSQGNYKIIISEDQMQGEEWKGEFRLTLKVE